MRKHMNVLAVLGVFALAMVPVAASAATFGGEVYGAFNTHSMQDWNDAIDLANTSGSNFDNVGSDITGGLDLRMWASPNWMFSAGWEPLFLNSEDSANPGDKLSLNANAYTVTGAYFFPSASNGKYGIGGGLGYYSNSGKLESTGSPDVDITGSGVGFHFVGLGEWTVSPGFSVTTTAGYRVAKLTSNELSDGTTTVDSPYDNDYSGFMGRVGLAFYLPTK
jgi:hypothetical protein